MRKSDKGKKVFGLILILAIIVSVFGGVVSAEDISEDLTKSVADTRLFDKNNNFDSAGENSYSNISKVNIPLPLTTRVEGIDVSHWQGNIDWSSVYNSGKKFAFAKATEGVGFTDPNFDKNMNEAHAAGMLIGAYHYARPDLGNDAADEARYFVSVAGKYLKDGYLRPALDLEEGASLGKVALSNWVHEWMETVKSETGIEPIIYVNSNYANNYLDSSVTKYNLWIAHWRCDTGTPPNTGIWADWDFWQYYSPNYCGQNSVPGISGGVDLDIFNGDMSSLYTFVITGGTDGIIPLTGDMYGNDIDITGFYNANTAEFTFGGEAVRFGQMADKGTDTTGTYYAGKSRFIFDKRTEDTANIEFANQSAELGVVGSRGLSFGTQVGEYINGVIAYSNYENAYASGLYNFVDGYNTGMKWQCVEYVNRYYKAIYGMEIRIPGTNANDYYGTASDRGLIAYPNSGSTSPQPGDILCSDGGSYGHVAIVRGVTTGSIHVIHQNWANTGADNDKIISMSISGGHYTVSGFSASYPVQGWLRKPGGITQIPITGDMYKSGTDTTGIYNTGTAEFTFDGKTVRFGQLNDKPIIGDWDGDGYDEIGLFRSSTSMFYLVTRNWATLPYDVGAADKDIPFSYPEYIPIAGDWEGDGDDDIGGYYPGTFYLYLLNLGSSTATSYRDVPFGDPGDILLIGDWDNDGDDDVAVCRKYDINDNPTYYFDLDLTGVEHEIGPCEWGDNDDIPIAGRWNVGSGDKIGVYRPSTEGFHFSYDIPQIQECEGTDTSCGIYPNCENCNEDDGCYLYDNGCEERNYYCASNEAGCGYTYSNRHTDGWVDTGNTDWVDVNECLEKERKEQQYRDYYCSGGACTYSVTGTQWVDTGNTRNKPDGTICGCTASNTLKRCYGGVCTDTGICDSTNCDADAACDGKEPGDSCGGGICDSNCKCVSGGNMAVNPTSWNPTINCGESDSQIVTVSATGGTVEGVTVSKISGETWLTLSQTNLGDIPSSSSETFTVTAAPPAGTSSGDYPYTIRVSNTCGTPSTRDVSGTITTIDPTQPSAVTDLATTDPTSNSIKLTWTAPGDDGNTGTATTYDIRYLNETPIAESNWASAIQCTDETSPNPAGSAEAFVVTSLSSNTTYYFALKTADEVPNWSPISNSPYGITKGAAITATREISPQQVMNGSTFTVTVTIIANQDIYAPLLDEDPPTGWSVTPVQNDGATFKESEIKWLWMESLSTGDSTTVIYDVTVPSGTTPEDYTITGNVSAYGIEPITVGGGSTITVITDWNPWDDDGIITDSEIQEAVYCWLTDTPKNDHLIMDSEIQELVYMWLMG